MGICPKRVYKSLEKESSFSLDLDETMANEETKEVQKDIHDDSHESPFILSKENEFTIEGDKNETDINAFIKESISLIDWVEKIKNDNSFLDDYQHFLQAALILEKMNATIESYDNLIETIQKIQQNLINGGAEIALFLSESKFFQEPSTDNSSEGDEREDT
jgi:hypothetical protein